jgi:Crinkler effector protein N-terminal domain
MSGHELRTFWCLVDVDHIPFKITAPLDADVADMKKLIQEERKYDVLREVGPHTLILWKVRHRPPTVRTE